MTLFLSAPRRALHPAKSRRDENRTLAESILDSLPSTRIVPGQRFTPARDDARTTFQAAIMFDVDQPVRFQRVDTRRTDKSAVLDRALASANFLIHADMAL